LLLWRRTGVTVGEPSTVGEPCRASLRCDDGVLVYQIADEESKRLYSGCFQGLTLAYQWSSLFLPAQGSER